MAEVGQNAPSMLTVFSETLEAFGAVIPTQDLVVAFSNILSHFYIIIVLLSTNFQRL